MSRALGTSALAVIVLLAACSGGGETPQHQTADADTAAPIAERKGGVARDPIEPGQPAVQPMAAAIVIQSQPGPDGSQVDLLKAGVTGDILTVTLSCTSSERVNSKSFRVSDISVIDDATSQRIAVLKDNEGKWMASNVSGDHLGTSCEQKPGIIWAKFPAPPATSKTVSINLPEVAPFDGVPITR